MIVVKNNIKSNVQFIGTEEPLILEKLNFAMQRIEASSIWTMPMFNLICFYDKIVETDSFLDLNVHHKYYIHDKKAW